MKLCLLITLLTLQAGCATMPLTQSGGSVQNSDSALASLRKQIEDIHGSRDAVAYSALHTEDAVFEWRGRATQVVGRAALEKNRREVWAARRESRLNLQAADVRVHGERAYEFGSYEETWIDAKGRRVTEFGRYVTAYARFGDAWRIARTFGYSDLTATKATSE
jgi:ketosteroid isomerase-like protein